MSKNFNDIVGKVFGKWIVNKLNIERTEKEKRAYYDCTCECGNKSTISRSSLVNGRSTHCKKCTRDDTRVDLSGQKIGKIQVIKRLKTDKNNDTWWLCRCDCGTVFENTTRNLHSRGDKVTRSCGCLLKEVMNPKLTIDITNQKFGMLTAIEPTEKRKDRQVVWRCICDCGNEKLVDTYSLTSEHTKSCGCLQSEGNRIIKEYLQKHHIEFEDEYCFNDLKSQLLRGGKLRFDFAIFENQKLKCLIEYQGQQHYKEKLYYGEKKKKLTDFGKQQREVTDKMKKDYCKKNNIKLFEIKYNENVVAKLQQILHTQDNPVGSEKSQPVSTISGSGE